MTARGAMEHAVCQCCGKPFSARVADRKRGWAKACGKSCAATLRERRGLPMPRALGTVPPSLFVGAIDDGAPGMRTDGPEFDFSEDLDHGHL